MTSAVEDLKAVMSAHALSHSNPEIPSREIFSQTQKLLGLLLPLILQFFFKFILLIHLSVVNVNH